MSEENTAAWKLRAERAEAFVRLLVEKAKDHDPGDFEEVLANAEYWAGEYAHAEAMLAEVEAIEERATKAEARVKELEAEAGILTQGITDQHDRAQRAEAERDQLRESLNDIWNKWQPPEEE
jgi:hypothetical protein